jgi:hypothetical protein
MATTAIPARPSLRADQQIQQLGHCLVVDEDLIDRLGDVATLSHAPERNDDGSVAVVSRVDSLLHPADGMVFPNGGLLPVLAEMARSKGIPWNPAAFDRHISGSRFADNHLLPRGMAEFLSMHPRGRIRFGSHANVSALIAGISLASPTARIIVLASYRHQLEWITDDWRIFLPRRGVAVRNQNGGGVTLATWSEAGNLPSSEEFHEFDVAIVLNALDVSHRQSQRTLSEVGARFRLYAIERADTRPSPQESDLMLAALGPAVFEIPTEGVGAAHVQFASISVNPPPLVSVAELHRVGYWEHPERNRRIARVAKALSTGDPEAISRHPDISQWWRESGSRALRTVVCAANLQHAIHLLRRMPHASLATTVREEDLSELPRPQRELIAARSAHNMGNLIVTDGTRFWSSSQTDCVIVAGGGPGFPGGPQFESTGTARRRVLLVDFRDRHHPQLQRWSQQRIDSYEARDWFPVGTDEITGRVRTFLKSRPVKNEHRRHAR